MAGNATGGQAARIRHRRHRWRGGFVATACIWFALVPAAQAAEPTDAMRKELQGQFEAWARNDFRLPPELKLDEDLRQQALALGAEHRARVLRLFAGWAEEEAPLVENAKSPMGELLTRLYARHVNEMAAWQLDTTGEAFDALSLRSLQRGASCATLAGRTPAPFVRMVAELQHMPAADRAEALAAQRVLLARWGQPHALPARPVPSLWELTDVAIGRLRLPVRPADEPPLPPVLARALLVSPRQALDDGSRCALAAWWLRREAARPGARPAELLLTARYALSLEVAAFPAPLTERPASASDYPALARRFGVEGSITVHGRVRTGAAGLEQPRVAERRITVPGIRGQRPVAFETLLDQASLARAAEVVATQAAPGQETDVSFNWSLQ
jgi:hypothetical protein